MNDSLQTDILAWPTVILSFLSFLSCLYVCWSSCKSSRSISKIQAECAFYQNDAMEHHTERRSTLMMNIIFWMCVTDGLHAIELILNWMPQALHLPFWDVTPCKVLGFFGQFFGIQSPTWHVILAYHLCYLLLGGTIHSLHQQKKYHYVVATAVPIICSVLPIVLGHSYGSYQNNTKINDFECWITSVHLQMIWVVFNIVAMFAHFFALSLALYKWKKSIIALSNYYKQIVIKILRFVVVYTLIRIFPTTDRIVELFRTAHTEPFWLIFCHHIFLAVTGIGNGLVWIINQRYDPMSNQDMHYKMGQHKVSQLRESMLNTDPSSPSLNLNQTDHVLE